MKIVDRSYSSKMYRPKPVISLLSGDKTVIVATSWTQQEHAQKVIHEVTQYLDSSFADVEVTSPFEYLPQLAKPANNLRIALLIANDILYRVENRSEFTAAVEVSILHQAQNQIFYAQVGQPQIFLQRGDFSVQPISVSVDLKSPPLPKDLLGFDLRPQIQMGQFEVQNEDRVILLSSSYVSPEFFNKSSRSSINNEIQDYTKKIAQAWSQEPFWISLLEID